MRHLLSLAVVILFLVSISPAQEVSREQKLQQILELNAQLREAAGVLLAPATADISEAKKNGFEVFRIMPRGKIGVEIGIRGGGAYYSFSNRSHDYNSIAEIEFEQNYLSVGFAGADYGFIKNLGELPLISVTEETYGVAFLAGYKPPAEIVSVRREQSRSNDYQTAGLTYKRRVPAVVGNTYVLRAISFDEADVLVAFKIHREDTDGSLIIFWRILREFEKPTLIR